MIISTDVAKVPPVALIFLHKMKSKHHTWDWVILLYILMSSNRIYMKLYGPWTIFICYHMANWGYDCHSENQLTALYGKAEGCRMPWSLKLIILSNDSITKCPWKTFLGVPVHCSDPSPNFNSLTYAETRKNFKDNMYKPKHAWQFDCHLSYLRSVTTINQQINYKGSRTPSHGAKMWIYF